MKIYLVLFLALYACSVPNRNVRLYSLKESDTTEAMAYSYGRHGIWWKYTINGEDYYALGTKDRKGVYLGETRCKLVYDIYNPNNSVLLEDLQLPQFDAIAEIKLHGIILNSYRKGEYIIAVCRIEEQAEKRRAKEWEQVFTVAHDSIIKYYESTQTALLLTVYVSDTNESTFQIHEAILDLEPFPDSIQGPTVYWYKDTLD